VNVAEYTGILTRIVKAKKDIRVLAVALQSCRLPSSLPDRCEEAIEEFRDAVDHAPPPALIELFDLLRESPRMANWHWLWEELQTACVKHSAWCQENDAQFDFDHVLAQIREPKQQAPTRNARTRAPGVDSEIPPPASDAPQANPLIGHATSPTVPQSAEAPQEHIEDKSIPSNGDEPESPSGGAEQRSGNEDRSDGGGRTPTGTIPAESQRKSKRGSKRNSNTGHTLSKEAKIKLLVGDSQYKRVTACISNEEEKDRDCWLHKEALLFAAEYWKAVEKLGVFCHLCLLFADLRAVFQATMSTRSQEAAGLPDNDEDAAREALLEAACSLDRSILMLAAHFGILSRSASGALCRKAVREGIERFVAGMLWSDDRTTYGSRAAEFTRLLRTLTKESADGASGKQIDQFWEVVTAVNDATDRHGLSTFTELCHALKRGFSDYPAAQRLATFRKAWQGLPQNEPAKNYTWIWG